MRLVLGLPSPWDAEADLRIRPWFYTGPDPAPTVRMAYRAMPGMYTHRDGYWIWGMPLGNALVPFGGGWTQFVLNWPDQNRELFTDAVITEHLHPSTDFEWLYLPEDGHNEDIIAKISGEFGYHHFVDNGWLHITR